MRGRKRHIIVDTLGLVLALAVHPADVRDRDGAALALALARLRPLFRWVRTIFADAAHASDGVAVARLALGITALIIVRRLAALPWASGCSRSAGSLNGPSAGSADGAGWRAITSSCRRSPRR